MKSLIRSASLPLLCLSFLAACGGNSGSGGDSSSGVFSGVNQNEEIQADGSNLQGNYAASIWPVNHNLHLKEIGTVGIKRQDDSFTIGMSLKYGPKGRPVKAAVYTGRRCPNLKDDLNHDAYIDILEAKRAIGKILIPLDSDLDSQMGGAGDLSVDSAGKLTYSQTASFSRMFADLHSPDNDSTDDMIRLNDDEGITLPGRIVLLQGMPDRGQLPDTVDTVVGVSPYDSIPVGCAVLWKVNEMPADLIMNGEVPMPAPAPVESL